MTTSVGDVLIVGGGIIGCSLARELAGRGVSVVVLERGEPGMEASSAAAGMLSPQVDATGPGPLFDLGLESREIHAAWAADLAQETEIDVGYRRCGILRCSFERGRLAREFGWQQRRGLTVERPDVQGRTNSGISARVQDMLFFPLEGVVDSGRLTRALALSAARRGAKFLSHTTARRFLLRNGVCAGVETENEVLEAGAVVNAAGAWASFDSALPFAIPVLPARGQALELDLANATLSTVVQGDDVYLVPRAEGKVILGATVEQAGFQKCVTAEGMAGLLTAAVALMPAVADAAFVGAWAGLRPATPDGLPILGRSPIPRLFLATGHFRSGILLAPVTARRMADLLMGSSDLGLEPFSIARFGLAQFSLAAGTSAGVFS